MWRAVLEKAVLSQVEAGITSSDYLLAFLLGTRRTLSVAGRRTQV